MRNLWQDLRYGMRMLLKAPGFTVVAVIALALGIGANTAIFSIVNAIVFQPFVFRDSDRLVQIWATNPRLSSEFANHHEVSAGDLAEWRKQASVFEDIAAYRHTTFNLTGVGEPERFEGARVSGNYFAVLGAEPLLGRMVLPEDDRPEANRVVVMSHGLWQRRFGGDPRIIGQTLTLNGDAYTVVGVLRPDFQFIHLGTAALWTPFAFNAQQASARDARSLYDVGRLKPNVTLEQAQAELNTISDRLAQSYPETNREWGARIVTLQDEVTRFYRAPFLILLGAVGFVLLIACANVANLLLTRTAGRGREMAVRTALGAGRWRLVQQLATESVLLALLGGAAGLLLAAWGIDLILASIPSEMRNFVPRYREIGINGKLLAFTFLVSLVASLIFGLVPALQASHPDLNEALKEGGGKTTGGVGNRRLRGLLIVSEVALALILLVGASLMVKSFIRLQQVDPGFDAENVLTTQIDLPRAKYTDNNQITAFYDRVLEEARRIPGATSVGAINRIPMSGANTGTAYLIEGQPAPASNEDPLFAQVRMISPDYFQTMNTPLLQGRSFTERDHADAPLVVAVNQSLARRHFGSEADAIGKRIAVLRGGEQLREIVGVVRDVKYFGLDDRARMQIYVPYPQLPDRSMNLAIRTTGDPVALASAVRNAVWAVDRDQPVSDIRTMRQMVYDRLMLQRYSSSMLSAFAIIAIILAAVGIYGVVAYSVAQRTHEIGIRMALGAQRSDILKMVVGQGLVLVLIGVGIGLAGAFALTRVMASVLYGVSATDLYIFSGVALLLIIVALIACYIPARRATKVDPMLALRYE